MTLRAVLFEFNGVIINDDLIRQQIIEQILIEENLRPQPGEFRKVCLGRSDRICLTDLLNRRGRVVSESYLNQLLQRKAVAYQQQIEKQDVKFYSGLEDLLFQMQTRSLLSAIVTGASSSEVQLGLNRAHLAKYFPLVVAGDQVKTSKPETDAYLLAVERLNEFYPNFNLQISQCLAVESTLAGIQAAKKAGMKVVGVANIYPFHMLQRQANWTVDYLCDLDIDRVQQVYTQKQTA